MQQNMLSFLLTGYDVGCTSCGSKHSSGQSMLQREFDLGTVQKEGVVKSNHNFWELYVRDEVCLIKELRQVRKFACRLQYPVIHFNVFFENVQL